MAFTRKYDKTAVLI